MMANTNVLPIDPKEFYLQKGKRSFISSLRKKLQKLRTENNNQALRAIHKIKGTRKVDLEEAARWATSFESLLNNEHGLTMFKNFQKSEFSEENIEFWIACEKFKKTQPNKLVALAQKIYDNFVDVDSPNQVNLDCTTRKAIAASLETPTKDSFQKAQTKIQYLMENDSYKRFLQSQAYKGLMK